MPQRPFYLVLVTPASGSRARIPRLFLQNIAASFPTAKIIEFDGDTSSFKPWLVEQYVPEGAQVIVQPLCIVEGEEYLNLLVALDDQEYKSVRVGFPLLSAAAGLEKLAGGFFKEQESALAGGCDVVFVGHGSRLKKSEAMYEKLGECLARHHPALFAASLKSDFETIVSCLGGRRSVLLIPLLINQYGSTWQKIAGPRDDSLYSRLEARGFACSAASEGLLYSQIVQDVFVDNIRLVLGEM